MEKTPRSVVIARSYLCFDGTGKMAKTKNFVGLNGKTFLRPMGRLALYCVYERFLVHVGYSF
ncbi:hypothetical protein [Commensalibacter sp. Nvir]|uniref:hypothetical protein n=1 Tax=Commensalibacter sp. Nvir TaxID=3069817 RepID=UPI0030C7DC82